MRLLYLDQFGKQFLGIDIDVWLVACVPPCEGTVFVFTDFAGGEYWLAPVMGWKLGTGVALHYVSPTRIRMGASERSSLVVDRAYPYPAQSLRCNGFDSGQG